MAHSLADWDLNVASHTRVAGSAPTYRIDSRFCLHKGAFRDALALRYGWSPQQTPMYCVCGASFTIEHALSCPRGGFPIVHHNEIRDVTANLLTEVCLVLI